MTYREAIARLKYHFSVHNDGRPTPKLDEAVELAIKAMTEKLPEEELKSIRDGYGLSKLYDKNESSSGITYEKRGWL